MEIEEEKRQGFKLWSRRIIIIIILKIIKNDYWK